MRSRRWLLASLSVIIAVATAGIGYAAFTSTANLNVNATAGTFSLLITGHPYICGGPGYVVLTSLTPSSTNSPIFTFGLGPFAPGDNVVVCYNVTNEGSLPASNIYTTMSVNNVLDTAFNAVAGGTPLTLAPGATFSSTITVSLRSGLGNAFQGAAASIMFTVVGSAGS